MTNRVFPELRFHPTVAAAIDNGLIPLSNAMELARVPMTIQVKFMNRAMVLNASALKTELQSL